MADAERVYEVSHNHMTLESVYGGFVLSVVSKGKLWSRSVYETFAQAAAAIADVGADLGKQPPPSPAPAGRDAGAAGEGCADNDAAAIGSAYLATLREFAPKANWSECPTEVFVDVQNERDAAVSSAENAIACAAERQAELDSVAGALGLSEPLVTVAYVLEAVEKVKAECAAKDEALRLGAAFIARMRHDDGPLSHLGEAIAYKDLLLGAMLPSSAAAYRERLAAAEAEIERQRGVVRDQSAMGVKERRALDARATELRDEIARLTREAEGHAALVAQVRQMRERSTRYLRASDAHELLVMDLENITSRVDAALASSRPEATERPIVAASPEGEKCVVCLGCLHRTPCDPTEAAPPTCALGHELEHVQPGFPRVAGSAWGWHRVGHPTCVDRAKAEREEGEDA